MKILSKVKNLIHSGEETTNPPFDIFSPEVLQNPYPFYRELRDNFPVHYFKSHHVWAITRYDDTVEILKKPDIFSAHQKCARLRSMQNLDGPEHARIRKIGAAYFSDPNIQAMKVLTIHHTNRCIAAIIQSGGVFDLISDFASTIPICVIAETLGIGLEFVEDLKRWTKNWIVRPPSDKVEREAAEKSMSEFEAFLADHVAFSEKHPGRGFTGRLLQRGPDDEKIPFETAVELMKLIVLAGSLTAASLVANAVLALLRHPDELKLLRANPHLVASLIEETLRYDSPAMLVPRVVTRDIAIRGARLKSGDSLALLLGSANRDERQFTDPDRFSLKRNPEGHIAFGEGAHFCLGARVARMESRIMLEALLFQMPPFQPAVLLNNVAMIDSLVLRGPDQMQLMVVQ
jgi:cytochrome P450